jgi:hypothetical protein
MIAPEDLPSWVFRLVAAVERFEDVHSPGPCLADALSEVPADVRLAAEVGERFADAGRDALDSALASTVRPDDVPDVSD